LVVSNPHQRYFIEIESIEKLEEFPGRGKVHGAKPKDDVGGFSAEIIEIDAETADKIPIQIRSITVPGGVLAGVMATNAIRKITMEKIKLGSGIGWRPFEEVCVDDGG
jgi:hypothetical protein